MKRAAVWTLSLAMMALACGCTPSGCGCGAEAIMSTSTDMPTAGAPRRKMKVVQLRPGFIDNRPMPSGTLKPIDPNATPPSKPAAPATEPASTGN
ncbi:MAG: hypothetical protein MUC50_24375 [Myxococcota bacterium]|nr:hypothetical protein [Myxococcota bacterium]